MANERNSIRPTNGIKYESYFSKLSLKRTRTPLRATGDNIPSPDVCYLSGGFPPAEMFPIVHTEITLRDGTKLNLDKDTMEETQQYGDTYGMAGLHKCLVDLVRRVHNPPTLNKPNDDNGLGVLISAGGQSALHHCFNIVLSEGDTLLVQNPTYATMIYIVQPIGATVIGVESDKDGIISSKMEELLENWEQHHKTARRPRVLYCVPTGDNPRGASWSQTRRQEVYNICRKYEMLIMEDDAYYFTHFTRPLPPSLLSLDVDGRVIRFDTFSKILAPGIRLGYVSAPKPVIELLATVYQTSVLFPSQLSQVFVLSLLRHWGNEGFLRQGERTAALLKRQANYILEAANKYLKDVCEWDEPKAGMFLWVKFKRLADASLVVEKCKQRGVLIVAGHFAIPQVRVAPFVRLAFGMPTKEELFRACKIIGEVARELEQGS
ncbi:hypothetical protein LOTGIDRAFT_202579 [Lottia gigantea]|uniref:Aminotransferase class I/classII large domain-containing protein n=1 Tax=Lottia gigantea TaxID=225164 RepID=V4A8B0_LOTGI|nr:hypothetical protein LOTGIDRAFT_202579 [Lottia gigantea]ESO92952.1 hypothetical protein LOTGIDRAFT_202579 [Lottia gigantea]